MTLEQALRTGARLKPTPFRGPFGSRLMGFPDDPWTESVLEALFTAAQILEGDFAVEVRCANSGCTHTAMTAIHPVPVFNCGCSRPSKAVDREALNPKEGV